SPSAGHCSATLLFPFALRPLLDDLVCQILGLFLAASSGGNNHLCCALSHCGSHNIYSSFPYWVLPSTALVRAGITGVPLLRFLEECLTMNLRLRLLLVGVTLSRDTVKVCMGCAVLAFWWQTCALAYGGYSHGRTAGFDRFHLPIASVQTFVGIPPGPLQLSMLPGESLSNQALALPLRDVSDEEIKESMKGKAKVGEKDLSKPFKEETKENGLCRCGAGCFSKPLTAKQEPGLINFRQENGFNEISVVEFFQELFEADTCPLIMLLAFWLDVPSFKGMIALGPAILGHLGRLNNGFHGWRQFVDAKILQEG
nr:hypothetical protein [Tanacetum cinerariifolium]